MSDQRLDKLLQHCTVRLNVAGGQGTGFFIAPGLILTCAHVIGNASSEIIDVFWKLKPEPFTARIRKQVSDLDFDLALLKLVDELKSHPCIYIDHTIPRLKDNLYTFGYPLDSSENYSGGESVTVEHEGDSFKGNSLFLKFKEGQIKKGASGSPLLNLRTGGVCGMVAISRNTSNSLGGRAIPMNIITSKLPELMELNSNFHQKDDCWKKLLPQAKSSSLEEDATKRISNLSFQLNQAYKGSLWDKVVELGEYILKLDVKHQPTLSHTAYAYRSRSINHFERGNYDLAILDCTRAIELFPKADYYWQRSRNYHACGEWDRAIQDCNQAIQLESKACYYWQRGRAYHNKGNYRQGMADAKIAIQIEPKQADYHYLCGLSHSAMQEFGQALERFNKAIQLNSKQPQYYLQRGVCNINLGNLNQAINDLNFALSCTTKLEVNQLTECHYLLGIGYAGSNNHFMAVKHLTTAIMGNSQNPYYYFQRGWSYYRQGLYREAENDANEAIQLDVTNLDFYKLLTESQNTLKRRR